MKDNELTLRGLLLGSVIAIVFTAANIYLGLRVAITIASSIPAAVISMGVLRLFKTGNIRENNIVQTVASSGGTLSSIIFVLPGLVMIGYWEGFDTFTTFMVCALGGILGVLFSIPLRRTLVVNTPLPFPEGVAAAEVLKAGATGEEASPDAIERERGPIVVAFGALMSAGLQAITFTGVAATETAKYFRVLLGASGVDLGYSLALLGAGHLVGISVGLAMIVGVLIAWAGFVPIWTQGMAGDPAVIADAVWRQVRFVGAGVIATAAIWSMIKLVKPLIEGFQATMKARAAHASAPIHARDDRDIPLWLIALLSAICLVLIGWLLWNFIDAGGLSPLSWPLTIGGVIFVVVVGFFIATVAGYMAALIGASNSPVSGIGILATVIGAVLLAAFAQPLLGPSATRALVAFCLFAVSIVFSVATISNDNLQDLKTGQLVGASPWRQQVALIVGVLAGSLIIPFVLNVLNHAYGFPGDPNRHAIGAALGAPQATLISTLANGVLNGNVPWNLILRGVIVGVICIAVDETLGVMKLVRLPPLAVGISIYLPMSATQPVVVGAICGWLYNRAMDKRPNAEMAKRFGVLLASGLVVGESLLGIVNSGVVVATNNPAPFALVGANFAETANIIAVVLFVVFTLYAYWWVSRQSKL